MRPTEARHIGTLLAGLRNEEIDPVLNVGSSTLRFRQVDKPHIDAEIFRPLAERGVTTLHLDSKQDEGVDIVGDIYSPAVQRRAKEVGAKLLICSNILEHVADPAGFAAICGSLVAPGGRIVVTVPYSYPYHPDPLDTYFRPSPERIAELFDGFELAESRIIEGGTYLTDLLAENSAGRLVHHFARHGLKFFWPFSNFDAWKARYHRYLWLVRPYLTSYALLARA